MPKNKKKKSNNNSKEKKEKQEKQEEQLKKEQEIKLNELNEQLASACENKNKESVLYLIEEGADVNYVDLYDTPLLFYAFDERQDNPYEIIETLINYNVDVNKTNNQGETVLYSAIWCHSSKASYNTKKRKNSILESIKLLIKEGATINMFDNKQHYSLISGACANADYEIIKLLLDEGADVNLKNVDNKTALNELYISNNYITNNTYSFEIHKDVESMNNIKKCFRLLIDYKADVNIKYKNNKNIFDMLTYSTCSYYILLVAEQFNANLLIKTILQDNSILVNDLIKNNKYINVRDDLGRTAIYYCAKFDCIQEYFNVLLKSKYLCLYLEDNNNKSIAELITELKYEGLTQKIHDRLITDNMYFNNLQHIELLKKYIDRDISGIVLKYITNDQVKAVYY